MGTVFLVVAFLASALAGSGGVAAEPSVIDREERDVRGWTVRVGRRLLDETPVDTARALELLEAQLAEIERVVPAAAVVSSSCAIGSAPAGRP